MSFSYSNENKLSKSTHEGKESIEVAYCGDQAYLSTLMAHRLRMEAVHSMTSMVIRASHM